jgi:hypothetical protein
MTAIPALRNLRQEDWEFKARLGYKARCPPSPQKRSRRRKK